jgi:hypothetical protein
LQVTVQPGEHHSNTSTNVKPAVQPPGVIVNVVRRTPPAQGRKMEEEWVESCRKEEEEYFYLFIYDKLV